jgi:ERCC4-type nuclease
MYLANRYDKNIFCLEGDWETDLRKKSSVQSALLLLESNLEIATIYKTCSTYEEFCSRLHTLTSDKRIYGKYSIIYLAFHGRKNKIQIGEEDYSLDEIGHEFENALDDKIIHFGSCKTLFIEEKKAREFLENTGALAISGYAKNIDFISSTVFDVLYFEMCQNYVEIDAIERNMLKNYKELCEALDFKIYY